MTVALYSDGGTVGRNPSPIGGTWAWCLVVNDKLVDEYCGLVEPADMGMETISNNLMELYAALRGIEALPEGFNGRVYTDSLITLYRITYSESFNGVPEWLKERVKEARSCRKWFYDCVLLGGHPNKKELEEGRRKDGKMVSKWNVRVDQACSALAKKWLAG